MTPSQIRRLRWYLLEVMRLHRDLEWFDVGFLAAAVRNRHPDVTPDLIEEFLEYLKGHKCVRSHSAKDAVMGDRRTVWELLNRGVDVLDGNVTLDGVEL